MNHLCKRISDEKNKIRELHGLKRVEYIWDYYKLPLILICILVYILGYISYSYFTHKETELSVALVNISVSDDLSDNLSDGFLKQLGADTSKRQIELYTGISLTEENAGQDLAYSYASQMKLMAAVSSEHLDVILMDKAAFEILSRNDYLCSLDAILSESAPDLLEKLAPYLYFDNSSSKKISGLDLSDSPIIQQASLNGTVYLGIIENSTRKDTAAEYINYLFNPKM